MQETFLPRDSDMIELTSQKLFVSIYAFLKYFLRIFTITKTMSLNATCLAYILFEKNVSIWFTIFEQDFFRTLLDVENLKALFLKWSICISYCYQRK